MMVFGEPVNAYDDERLYLAIYTLRYQELTHKDRLWITDLIERQAEEIERLKMSHKLVSNAGIDSSLLALETTDTVGRKDKEITELKARPMVGFFAGLTIVQQSQALAYRGDEDHGVPSTIFHGAERAELLEALQGLLSAFERTSEHPSYVSSVPEYVTALAAIAKATGAAKETR